MIAQIDHIVYAVPDLRKGCDQLKEILGVEPVYGGKHELLGTHNALVKIGESCYLELIATDPGNEDVVGPRWMGVDFIDSPIVTRWALKSQNIKNEVSFLTNINASLGEVKEGQRHTPAGNLLTWELSMPMASPKVEILPFLIDWKDSVHPSEKLDDSCLLKDVVLKHPNPGPVRNGLEDLGVNIPVAVGEFPSISIELNTPNGLIVL